MADQVRRRPFGRWRGPLAYNAPMRDATPVMDDPAVLRPIGVIRSTIVRRGEGPKQGTEGAPDVWLDVNPSFADGLMGIAAGADLLVLTWLHQGQRDVLRVRPRNDPNSPVTGVFNTRSPDRPNPIGLHPVTVRARDGLRLRIGPMEAIDGTPVIDIKPVL